MKPQNRLNRLSSLREEIGALRAVKCHMSHEQVIRDADSMLPVVCRFPAGNYQRIGLCSPEVRSQRLGCSHTTARIKLGNAIDELDLAGADNSGPASFLAHELNWLNNEIHLLDHRKGDAEKTLAKILEETRVGRVFLPPASQAGPYRTDYLGLHSQSLTSPQALCFRLLRRLVECFKQSWLRQRAALRNLRRDSCERW